jgi:hypothetical protein
MHDVLQERAAELSRLAAKIRTSLDEAEKDRTVNGTSTSCGRLSIAF